MVLLTAVLAEAAYLANIHNEVDVTVDRNGVSYSKSLSQQVC